MRVDRIHPLLIQDLKVTVKALEKRETIQYKSISEVRAMKEKEAEAERKVFHNHTAIIQSKFQTFMKSAYFAYL